MDAREFLLKHAKCGDRILFSDGEKGIVISGERVSSAYVVDERAIALVNKNFAIANDYLNEEIYKVNDVEFPVKTGFFDGVTTWRQAIRLLEIANRDEAFSGTFKLIDNNVYFDLNMSNTLTYAFTNGRKLMET